MDNQKRNAEGTLYFLLGILEAMEKLDSTSSYANEKLTRQEAYAEIMQKIKENLD